MSQPVTPFPVPLEPKSRLTEDSHSNIPPGQCRPSTFLSTVGEKSIKNHTIPFFIYTLLYYLLSPRYK